VTSPFFGTVLGDRDDKTFGLPEPKGIRDDKEIRFEKIKDLR
jgi:hypothetical protein